MPDEKPDKKQDGRRSNQRGDRDRGRRDGRRNGGKDDGGKEDNSGLKRRIEAMSKFATIVENARRRGLDAADAAGEHADRAFGAQQRAAEARPTNDDVARHARAAKKAADEAMQLRYDAEGAYKELLARRDEFAKAKQQFDTAVEQRDAKTAQQALDAADRVTDAVTDAIDPISTASAAANAAADRADAAATQAIAAAAQANDDANDTIDAQLAAWQKILGQFVETTRADRARAVTDAEAAKLAAERAREAAERAQAATPVDSDVEKEQAAANAAAERARSAAAAAAAASDELDKYIDALRSARERFEAAVKKRDVEAAQAALAAADAAADQVNHAADSVAEALAKAATAAAEAQAAADRAEAAARRLSDDQAQDEVEENARAVGRVKDAWAVVDKLGPDIAELVNSVDGAGDDLPEQLAKGERCADRAARSPQHEVVARAALATAREQADLAIEVRRQIDELVKRLAALRREARDLMQKAVETHEADPTDRSVRDLASAAEKLGEEIEVAAAALQVLVRRLREHLQNVAEAIDEACDAAKESRPPRPTGPGGVLHPPRLDVVPTPDPDAASDHSEDDETPLTGKLPLLLVPVRIETRFGTPADGVTPLRIRVYPDRISVSDDLGTPTEAEVQLARQYWTLHFAGQTAEDRDAAWGWLVDLVDTHRAGYLARMNKPTQARNGAFEWPDVVTTDVEKPGFAEHLPNRFVAIGWSDGVEVFRQPGARIDGEPYHTSLDPLGEVSETDLGVATTKHMAWMVDYAEAERRGMAITVDAQHSWDAIDTLMVLGVDGRAKWGDDASTVSADTLQTLLDSHAISQGLAFVPQGTPTNNTDTVEAGWTRRQRERDVVASQRDLDLADKVDIEIGTNVERFARALGLSDPDRLARQPFARDTEWGRGAAMRAALYDVVIGRYIEELLPTDGNDILSEDDHEELRDWFVNHVAGGAAVPTIRVGSQPYAVLPVLRPGNTDVRPTIGHRVARVVRHLKDEWIRTLDDGVARLNHQVGEDPEAVRGNIAEVLASEPHPADLSVRRLDLHERTGGDFDKIGTGLLVDFENGAASSGDITWVDIDNGFVGEFEFDRDQIENDAPDLWQQLVAMRGALGMPFVVEDQIVIWSKFRDLVKAVDNNPWGEAAEGNVWIRGQLNAARTALPVVDDVLAGLIAHEQRQRPLATLNLPSFDGVLGNANPPLIVSKFLADAAQVERPLSATDAIAPADYVGPAMRGETIPADAPLLAQLLHSAALSRPMKAGREGKVIAALSEARSEDLDWTLRETLGLGIHRLDAWHTAFANQELAALRMQQPDGLHVGSYGWVTDLAVPTKLVTRASHGFLHAPSLGHAATASVIRSGWKARGDTDGASPAAVDLRSNRFRYAVWLIEGVRAGQPLGDLLGYEFERLCHDLGIDEQIAEVRQLVGIAHGRSDGIEDPVDGIELMELFADSGLDTHLSNVEARRGTDHAEKVRLLLEGLAWSFDAMDDALLAESTHHLLAGNFERAAASIEAGSGGSTPPPMPIGMDTSRPVRTVNHKVLLLADASSDVPASGWDSGVRDVLSPAFESLAASLLPPPGNVAVTVVGDGNVHAHSLADIGLSALDATYLSSDDPTGVDAPFASVVASAVESVGVIDTSLDPLGLGVTFEEFQIVATSLRRLLSESRIASADDLDPELVGIVPDDATPNTVDAVLGERLIGDLKGNAAGDDAARRRRLALAGLVGADGDVDRIAARRLEAARALDAPTATDVGGAVFGRPFPIGSPMTVAETGARFDTALADADSVHAWLDDVALVRGDVDRLVSTLNLSSLLGAQAGVGAGTAQAPRHPGDNWAATGLPVDGTGGRNVMSAVWNGRRPDAAPASVVALVIDQWSEQIPSDTTTTGVAMHYDAPSQRPPQAMLLGVPETDEPWTIGSAIDLLLDAMEWMQLRAVAPEDLGDYGHTIPTVFTNTGLAVDALPDTTTDSDSSENGGDAL